MAEGLRLGFGEGAMLVPFALILFAVTMFLPTDSSLVARVAVGLALVVLSALSMLSILVPGSDAQPALVLEADVASSYGGYVGSGVAWLLLTCVGQLVGMVLLVGMAVCGIVVCGFSISNLVLRIRNSLGVAAEHIAAAHETHSTRRREAREAVEAAAWDEPKVSEPETAVMDEPETSFIGSRKTSVLRRGAKTTRMDHATGTRELDGMAEKDEPQPKTTLLGRRRHKKEEAASSEATQPFDAEATLAAADTNPALWDTPFEPPVAQAASSKEATLASNETADSSVIGSMHPEQQTAVPNFLLAAAAKKEGAAPEQPAKPRPGRGSRTKQKAAPDAPVRPGDDSDDFTLPPLSLLSSNPNSASSASSDSELDRTAQRLQATLEEFGLTSRVSGWTAGPLVTTFKIEMGEGERVNKITNLQDDIQLSLASESVRIFAPIPGTSLVGIEIPNRKRQNVNLGDVLPYVKGGPLELAIGRDAEGTPVVADLAKMPHLLIAGTTGSGKSVMINSIITTLLMRALPEDVRLIMVDPKRVELAGYNGLPHLYVPVVTEPKQAASALQWAVSEMERRLKVFERLNVRKISTYNEKQAAGEFEHYDNPPQKMPYLVIIIDELSDLMMVAGKDVEASIVRIAQLGRAAGIHLIVATQRPSSNVVTGLIKANITNRIAFNVATGIDSRVIIDQMGAEKLTGLGDMLFSKVDWGKPRRIQGCFVSDDEINEIVEFVKSQSEPDYHEEILSAVAPASMSMAGGGGIVRTGVAEPQDDDPLIWEAAHIVVDSQLGSTSGLQRRLKVGYARAGRIMDMLEEKGVVGPPDGSKPREVLLDEEGLAALESVDAEMAREDREFGGF